MNFNSCDFSSYRINLFCFFFLLFFFKDKTPPSIICPADIITESLPGKKYASVSWTIPNVTDNVDRSPVLWSKPYISFPWKVKIGTRTVMYVTQDSSGNRARCKFKVKVLGKLISFT